MMPKWTGSIPSPITTGRKIGVKINTAGVMSMNVPTASSKTLINSRITSGLSLSPSIALLTLCGMFS
jgi:hypothetical protein